MNIYNHIIYNPHLEGIQSVINRLGGDTIWALHHIVPITEYEWVAVFEAWDSFGDDQAALGKIPLSKTLTDCTPTKTDKQ